MAVRKDGNGVANRFEYKVKRAGFKVGIGRELYSSPFIWLSVETEKNDRGGYQLKDKFAKFEVSEIGYENRKINRLIIVNSKTGEVVYKYGINNAKPETKKVVTKAKAEQKEQPKVEPKAVVTTTSTLPTANVSNGETLCKAFIKKHNIDKERFVEMRAEAIRQGLPVASKSFKEYTDSDYIELIGALENMFFKDVS